MVDMPIDEHRLLRATGRMLIRPEVEEIEEAYRRVTPEQCEEMLAQFRQLYEVDNTVTDDHMRSSAQVAVAYDEVIQKHDIHAFGYFWWGEKELITQLRSQSALAERICCHVPSCVTWPASRSLRFGTPQISSALRISR